MKKIIHYAFLLIGLVVLILIPEVEANVIAFASLAILLARQDSTPIKLVLQGLVVGWLMVAVLQRMEVIHFFDSEGQSHETVPLWIISVLLLISQLWREITGKLYRHLFLAGMVGSLFGVSLLGAAVFASRISLHPNLVFAYGFITVTWFLYFMLMVFSSHSQLNKLSH